MQLLDFSNLKMRFEPFPIGIARPVIDDATYRRLLESFPSIDLFDDYAYIGKRGDKLTLSEKVNYRKYHRIIAEEPWKSFYGWIKSADFHYYIMGVLQNNFVDLGYKRVSIWARAAKLIKDRNFSYFARNPVLRSRFEFSILRGSGGYLPPHTDAPSKAVTIIVSIAREAEWSPAWGGGTSVNRPKDARLNYNKMNIPGDYADMEVVETYPFLPNQAIIFVKTHNSWHSVEPIHAPDPQALRRTLTINIETY